MRVRLIFCWLLAAGTLAAAPSGTALGAPPLASLDRGARSSEAPPPRVGEGAGGERLAPGAERATPAPGRAPGAERPVIQGALTVEQAVQTALRESPIVRGAVAEVEAAIGQLGVARANTRPIVSANAFAAGGSLGNIFTTTDPVMPRMLQNVGPGGFFDQNFMLMVPLYTGGRLRALVRQAETARRAESADLDAVRLEVATMTRVAYRQAQYQQALRAVYEALTTTHRERLRITQVSFDAGKVPQFYVLRDETEVANAEQQLTNTRRDAEQAMVALKTWMGVSLASSVQLAEPPRFEPVPAVLTRLGIAAAGGDTEPPGVLPPRPAGDPGVLPPANLPRPSGATQTASAPEGQQTLAGGNTPGVGGDAPNVAASDAPANALPTLLRLAEQRRPELIASRERLAGGRAGVRVARSAYQPQISAGAMADFMQMRGRDFLGGTTFGLVASLPILDGGLRRSQVREAEAERQRLEQERQRITLQVHQEVTNAWLALQAAAQNVRTAETGRRSAQEDYRVTQVRYEAGKGINLEVLDAVAARTRAETNVAQALYEYGVAQDQLQRAIGRVGTGEGPTPAPGKAPP